MNRRDEKYYRDIISLIDSDEQQEEVKKSQVAKRENKVVSQMKKKGSNYITMKKDKQSSNQSCIQMQRKPNCVLFQDVSEFNDIEITNNLSDHLGNLRRFIQNSQKNVLFVFGPSGCGKTLLTLTALSQSSLNYEFVQEKIEENQYGENVYEDNIDTLYRIFSFQDKIRQKIYISKDYPMAVSEMPSSYASKYKIFKENAYDLISNISNRNKYIFLLNSQIYSSYYLLSENSENKAINQVKNVSTIKIQPYGSRDMKKIISRFIDIHPEYSTVSNQSKALEQILTEANGDARKALNIIYYKKIREMGRLNPNKNTYASKKIQFYDESGRIQSHLSQSKKKHQFGSFGNGSGVNEQQQKEQMKVGIFHTLGKLLYGKRYNIFYNPADKKNKKSNNISCYYTQEQIDKYNPKFYFRPVELLEKSHLNLNVCVDLLEENFLNRYGKVRDIMKMYSVLRYYDSYLDDSLNKFEVKQQLVQNLKELITWGIIVYNKNSVKQSSFTSFQRSKNNIYQKIISKKQELIKTYFLRFRQPFTFKHNKKDIIQLGHLLKNNYRGLSENGFYLSKLIEIIFDTGRRSNSIIGGSLDKEVNVIQDEQQEIGNENCSKLNKIAQILQAKAVQQEKRRRLIVDVANKMKTDPDESDDPPDSDIDSD